MQSNYYTHHEPQSVASHLIKILLRLIRLKTLVERDMMKGGFKQDPAQLPKSLTEVATIDISDIQGRKIWTVVPKRARSEQVILFLHGGAYIYNMSSPHWQLVETLLNKTNATIIVPDYPLAPTATAIDSLTFMHTLYSRVLETTPADQIHIIGDSAGAGLALSFAQDLRNQVQQRPKQLILLAPFLDITMSNPDIAPIDKHDVVLNVKGLQLAGAAYAGDLEHTDYRVSPMYGDMTDLPKLSIFIGTHDLFIADSRKLKAKLKSANVAFNYYEYPKMIHDWVVMGMLPETKHAIEQITALIVDSNKS